ncbi:MAG: sugar ABC transporter substrate-binding protein [Actinobacteria bacterium HGW-Actinobacteria-4]|nr:MAG: sugar ABC transporter substrate-binding protein [Actinobacteria bacterium HGW-Actinobacteria-4]
MKRSSVSRAVAGAAIALITLAGCSTAADGDQPAPSGDKPTLSMWVNSADTDQLKDLYAAFTAETGYELNITSFPSDGYETALLQRWSTGDRPDILEWHGNFNWVAAVNPAANLRDLSDEEFVSRTVGGILDNNASVDGVVYGAILNTPTSFGLFYNSEVLDAAGVTPPTTSSELLAACEGIRAYDPSITPFHESAGSLWTPLVFHGAYMADSLQDGFFGAVTSRVSKVNDADSPWLASLEFYKEMLDAGCFNDDIMTAQFENSAQVLLDGQAAFVSMHTGFIQQAIDASDQERVDETIGWTPWAATRPVVTSESSPVGTYYLPVTGDDAREAGALEFIRFVTGPAYQGYVDATKQLPTLEGVATPDGIPAPWLIVQLSVEAYGSVPPIWVPLPGITDLVNYPGQVILGELTPQQAVDLLQLQAEQGAESAGLPAWAE